MGAVVGVVVLVLIGCNDGVKFVVGASDGMSVLLLETLVVLGLLVGAMSDDVESLVVGALVLALMLLGETLGVVELLVVVAGVVVGVVVVVIRRGHLKTGMSLFC